MLDSMVDLPQKVSLGVLGMLMMPSQAVFLKLKGQDANFLYNNGLGHTFLRELYMAVLDSFVVLWDKGLLI